MLVLLIKKLWDNFFDNLENEKFLENQFEGENDTGGIPGISSSSGDEDILLPINEIDEDAPLGENEPALSKKKKKKNILEMADLLLFY